jgi:hypothetical protein
VWFLRCWTTAITDATSLFNVSFEEIVATDLHGWMRINGSSSEIRVVHPRRSVAVK